MHPHIIDPLPGPLLALPHPPRILPRRHFLGAAIFAQLPWWEGGGQYATPPK